MSFYYYRIPASQRVAIKYGEEYDLRDEFDAALAAGSVNGTLMTPGPGTRVAVEVDGELSIDDGVCTFPAQATPGWGDQGLRSTRTFVRIAGKIAIEEVTLGATASSCAIAMWKADANVNPTTGGGKRWGLGFGTGSALDGLFTDATSVVIGAYTAATYQIAAVLRASGVFCFIKGGAFTYWTLLWADARGNDTPLYIAIHNYNKEITSSYIRVPARLWLPTPIAADTFTRANGAIGTSETTGPDSQPCTARTWTGTGATVASNVAVITPTAGATIWDAAAAIFTSGIYAWVTEGNNTVVNDANSLKITYVDDSDGAKIFFRDADDLSADLTVGAFYQLQADIKVNTGAAGLTIVAAGSFGMGFGTSSTTFVTRAWAFRATHATTNYIRCWGFGTGEILWIDNLGLKALTTSTLFSSLESSTADVVVDVDVTLDANNGSVAGLVMNLDDAADPQNFVIAYHNGGKAWLDKCVAGTWTQVVNATATYAAGATIRVIKSGTSYALFYNNAQVGSTSTISDAGIISNTLHGLFSIYDGNTLDDFVVFPRGSLNEFADLDRF